jgi:DNA repair protein RecO (recombination protein O)
MGIVRDQALFLQGYKYGESSLVLHAFGRSSGHLALVVKGALRPKSPLLPVLQPFSELELLFYHKPGRELQILKEAHLVRRIANLQDDYEKYLVGTAVAELLLRTHPVGAAHPELYGDTVELLELVSAAPNNERSFLYYYFLRQFQVLGVDFHPERCLICHRDLTQGLTAACAVVFSAGGIYCPRCRIGREGEPLSANAVQALQYLRSTPPARLTRRGITRKTGQELFRLLERYLKYHLEAFTGLRTGALLFGESRQTNQ